MLRHVLSSVSLALVLAVGTSPVYASVPQSYSSAERAQTAPRQASAILANYADIAYAVYDDAYQAALRLQDAVEHLLKEPSAEALGQARRAWLASRVPYQQSEVFRFGNPIVDDWEGRVNAWPLDEGLIDYVDVRYGAESGENLYFTANLIGHPLLTVGGQVLDAREINASLLRQLHEIGNVEANVATGYHAIEFLLWGQDLNGTSPGAGQRSYTDYDSSQCTHGHCLRRAAYLRAATDLLVRDLAEIRAAWDAQGEARHQLWDKGERNGLARILTGLGSLSYGELAGERMKLGLLLHDPEEEHDCFSDNTHNSHYYNIVGMLNVYEGRYVRTDGRVIEGTSLRQLLAEEHAGVSTEISNRLLATLRAASVMKQVAEAGKSYDQLLAEGDEAGNQILQDVIDRLVEQSKALEMASLVLRLPMVDFEGSDSLDRPTEVFQ